MASYQTPKGRVPKHVKERRRAERRVMKEARREVRRSMPETPQECSAVQREEIK